MGGNGLLSHFFPFTLNTVSEFAGNEWGNSDPKIVRCVVSGTTLVGLSSELLSEVRADVRRVTWASVAMEVTPSMFSVVLYACDDVLITLTTMSSFWSSRPATANKLLVGCAVSS